MGTGEVTHYVGIYGSAGVSKAPLLGVIPPYFRRPTSSVRFKPL
jgi:hypothetical protein